MSSQAQATDMCPHLLVWCNTVTSIYQCGIGEKEGFLMGSGPQEGCGRRWKDALLQEEILESEMSSQNRVSETPDNDISPP